MVVFLGVFQYDGVDDVVYVVVFVDCFFDQFEQVFGEYCVYCVVVFDVQCVIWGEQYFVVFGFQCLQVILQFFDWVDVQVVVQFVDYFYYYFGGVFQYQCVLGEIYIGQLFGYDGVVFGEFFYCFGNFVQCGVECFDVFVIECSDEGVYQFFVDLCCQCFFVGVVGGKSGYYWGVVGLVDQFVQGVGVFVSCFGVLFEQVIEVVVFVKYCLQGKYLWYFGVV